MLMRSIEVGHEERVKNRHKTVDSEGLVKEVFVLNIDEELPADNEHLVARLHREEVGGLQRLLDPRIQEGRKADEREALVELLEERRGVGVCEALGQGTLRESPGGRRVADGCDRCLGVLRKKDTNLVLWRQNARKSSLDGTKRSSQNVRRGEECVEGVALIGERAVEIVEREHPRNDALECGVCVVVGCGRVVERRDVAGDFGEDASPERGQLEK